MSRNPFFSDDLEDRLDMDVEVTHPGADDRFPDPTDRFNPHLLQPEEPDPYVHDHDEFVVMWEGDGWFSPRDAYQRLFERLIWGEIPPEEMPVRRCVAVGELPLVAAEMARGVNCCAVCVEDYTEGELVSRLPCGHCFHKDCISPWFQTRVTCPMCRFILV